MNIGLISPRGKLGGSNKYFQDWCNGPAGGWLDTFRNYNQGFSTALLVVAALTPDKHQVELVDENFDEVDFDKEYDLVGISCMTQQATRAYAIADEFRKRKRKVVLGGIHPTVLPEEAKAHADSVVVGEVEYLWEKMLRDCERFRLRDFYKSEEPVDMKDSPLPRFDLLDPKKYSSLLLQTSRGCPHDCDFCAASKVYGWRYREKSTAQVLREIEYGKSLFGDVPFYLWDDNFFVNKRRRRELLEQLISLNIRWLSQTDVSIAEHEDLLSLAYQGGCQLLFIGLESLRGENFGRSTTASGNIVT